MSKVDAMRAIRDARFAEAAKRPAAPRPARAAAAPAPTRARVTVPPATVPTTPPTASAAEPVAAEGLCGHRNMGGRSCTREADHQKTGTKSHRYG